MTTTTTTRTTNGLTSGWRSAAHSKITHYPVRSLVRKSVTLSARSVSRTMVRGGRHDPPRNAAHALPARWAAGRVREWDTAGALHHRRRADRHQRGAAGGCGGGGLVLAWVSAVPVVGRARRQPVHRHLDI